MSSKTTRTGGEKTPGQIRQEARAAAKPINFGGERLQGGTVTVDQAQRMIDKLKKDSPGIAKAMALFAKVVKKPPEVPDLANFMHGRLSKQRGWTSRRRGRNASHAYYARVLCVLAARGNANFASK